jgi:transcription elongation factor GreA
LVTVSDTQVTWLTQEAYGRLKQELDELIENRPVIAAKINTSREEGDLKENGGYHAAREEQGQKEARIRHLQELLRAAKVGEAPRGSWRSTRPSRRWGGLSSGPRRARLGPTSCPTGRRRR